MRTLVWFRGKDLRVADHGPLAEAATRGEVIPLFVLDPYFFAPERAAQLPHRMGFLLQSLGALRLGLQRLGSDLVLVPGPSWERVPRLAEQWRVDRVVAHRWSEPFGRERDRRVAEALGAQGIPFELFEGETLAPPGSLRTQAGRPFEVFSPFARAFHRDAAVLRPLPAPPHLPPVPADLPGLQVDLPTAEVLGLEVNPRVIPGGEVAAQARLARFLRAGLAGYAEGRNALDQPAGTSRLSADLKFGTLSVRAVWQAVGPEAATFRTELLWREFALHLLWQRPDLLRHPFKSRFEGFPWREDPEGLAAWKEGRTGYPVVDAAARQLLAEGFVPNRARMIAASFLTKDLGISYVHGEAHYLRFLVDGDWAANNLGWQWSAGSGCDAQPWFRIFNPVTQGERFDASGAYVRTWLPELSQLPDRWLHRPWEAPERVLQAAGVRLGETYPEPIVDHGWARARFLALAKAHLGS